MEKSKTIDALILPRYNRRVEGDTLVIVRIS